jgi:hypothetical protein
MSPSMRAHRPAQIAQIDHAYLDMLSPGLADCQRLDRAQRQAHLTAGAGALFHLLGLNGELPGQIQRHQRGSRAGVQNEVKGTAAVYRGRHKDKRLCRPGQMERDFCDHERPFVQTGRTASSAAAAVLNDDKPSGS